MFVSLKECIDFSKLTHDEIVAIAEHEHVPQIVAAQIGCMLQQTKPGKCLLKHYMLEHIKKHGKELAQLSREHHTALILTSRIKAAELNEDSLTELLVKLPITFDSELEPHFRDEEATLLPMLKAIGETKLVERTFDEHETMRKLISRVRAGDIDSLYRFGELLEAHVHFEEHELFAAAESRLTQEELAIVESETHNRSADPHHRTTKH